jgi:hypothetical protein
VTIDWERRRPGLKSPALPTTLPARSATSEMSLLPGAGGSASRALHFCSLG